MRAIISILIYAFVAGVPAWYGHTSWLLAKLAKMRGYRKEYILNLIALGLCGLYILIVTVFWVIGCTRWKG